MNQTQKRTHWASILEQQKQSQLSIKQFCQNNNICYHTFFYWSKRLRSPDPAQTLQPIEFDEFHHSAIGSVVLYAPHDPTGHFSVRSSKEAVS